MEWHATDRPGFMDFGAREVNRNEFTTTDIKVKHEKKEPLNDDVMPMEIDNKPYVAKEEKGTTEEEKYADPGLTSHPPDAVQGRPGDMNMPVLMGTIQQQNNIRQTTQELHRENQNVVKCQIAVPCALGQSKECPYTDAELKSYYTSAGGSATGKTRKQIAEAIYENKKDSAVATCALLEKLAKGNGTLLNWQPDTKLAKTHTPAQYIEFLKNADPKDDRNQPIFRQATHLKEIEKSALCKLSDDKTSLNEIVKLSTEQEFIRHYFTPQANLPGLLLCNSTGSGKTAAAISIATSSWVFEGYDVAWVTERGRINDYVIEAVNKLANMTNRVMAEKVPAIGLKLRNMGLNDARKMVQKEFVEPMSYEQLYNALTSGSRTTKQGAKFQFPLVPKADGSYRKTLLIIDEAHLFMHYIEDKKAGGFAQVIDTFQTIWDMTPQSELLKVICITATPVYKSPLDFFWLLSMIGVNNTLKQFKRVLPLTEQELNKNHKGDEIYKNWLNPMTHSLTEESRQILEKACVGCISYLNVSNDPSRFPQITSDVSAVVVVSDIQSLSIAKCAKLNQSESESEDDDGDSKSRSRSKYKKKTCEADENFSSYDPMYFADNPEFARKRDFIAAQLPYLSPKFQYLTAQIVQQNKQDLASAEHKTFKHVVYCNTAKTAKMVWSLLQLTDVSKIGKIDIVGTNMKIGTKKVDVEAVLKKFNSKSNAFGKDIAVLVIDRTIGTGYNLFDTKYLHLFEPTPTSALLLEALPEAYKPELKKIIEERANSLKPYFHNTALENIEQFAKLQIQQESDSIGTQVVGRVTRMCGSPNLTFTKDRGWELHITRYFSMDQPGAPGQPTIFQQQMTANKEINLDQILLKLQLQNLMLRVSLDREFPAEPGTVSYNVPHPGLPMPLVDEWFMPL